MEAAIKNVEVLKKRLTKFEANFKKCSTANRTKGYLKGRMEGIKQLWNEICQADEIIESLRTDEDETIDYFEDEEFSALEETYYTIVGTIESQLDAFNTVSQGNSNQNQNNRSQPPPQNNPVGIKLPKISLPTFSGSYHTWLSFKNRFTNMIHNKADLTNIEKLEYLKSCLTDDAERTIERFQITDQNYSAAWDRLNDKYDNKRILQDTQVETIIDRQSITKETASELRELIGIVQEGLEALKNLGVDTTTWDVILIVLIKRKLPFKTREQWEEELKPKDVPTLEQLVEFLEKRFRIVENLELVNAGTDKGIRSQHQNLNRSKTSQSNKNNCVSCNERVHPLMTCKKFLNMSVANRSAFINAKKFCKNCLAVSHEISECKSVKTCFKCGKKHHTLLHRDEPIYQAYNREPNYSKQTFVNQNQSYSNPNDSQCYSNPNRKSYVTNQGGSSNRQSQQNQIQNVHATADTTQNPQQNQPNRRAYTSTVGNEHPVLKRVSHSETLFPTALVKVKSAGGITYNLRVLLDQCSEEAFIKKSVAKMLKLNKVPIPSFNVEGLDGTVTSTINSHTKFDMIISNQETMNVEASIVESLVGILPKTEVRWPEDTFENLRLADPNFATPGNIDILLGGKEYAELIKEGVLKSNGYVAQNTKLGWIISGRSNEQSNHKQTLKCLVTRIVSNPEDILRKFWEIEEAPNRKQKKFTEEEAKCEQVFNESYRRMSDGRVQVKLPFKKDPQEELGESRNQAVARWLAMERKLNNNPDLKRDYFNAIQEHLDLGHMMEVTTAEWCHKRLSKSVNEVKRSDSDRYSCYYIPHHAVIREDSKTTKTRIVFDASAKTSSKKSLNDILMIGPTIQESLSVRIMKWRCHKYVLRGDITKMYRQIKVYEEDENYQRMVFRFDKTHPIQDFHLNTLTFGTASAPYMAIRTLKQLAIDEALNFPIGAKVVENDFHVDDLLTGGDSIQNVTEIWSQTRNLLKSAQMPMCKWSSNNNRILNETPTNEREFKELEIKLEDSLKTLGIGWLPIADQFFFKVPKVGNNEKLTKRSFLSQAAKLFDPLGWVAPAIIKPKIMFQSLWKQNLQWDDDISKILAQEWTMFRAQLNQLEDIRIPRWFGFMKEGYEVELHGFSDASEKAYGAVVYIKSTNEKGDSKVELVIAKSRVAPVQVVRLPRLELCGGALLSNLIKITKEELQIKTSYCWTDSSITLQWIDSSPDKYKTFVANRIAEIQENTDPREWRHVDSKQNPADCLSRGLDPEELKLHNLWWNGPSWLKRPKEQWPKNPNVMIPEDQMELKNVKALSTRIMKPNELIRRLLGKYTSFKLLCRVTARIRTLSNKNRMKSKYLSVREIENERMFWIKIVQTTAFSEEIASLELAKPVSGESKLLAFHPFFDSKSVLRVGGRLKEAHIAYDNKHQIILPKESEITRMIVNDAHEITKHGGVQLTMTYTRTQYWIIDTRNVVRNIIGKCVTCHRYKKLTQEQLMGNLPEPRVNLTRAFLHTGIDYAGPIQVLSIKKPGKRQITKGYIAVFVCLCTKAMHLELVSSLTSEAFLATFKRFTSRRGLPSNMYSDNAKTFIGAKNEMDEDFRRIKEVLEPELADVILNEQVSWSFIPPHAPHWGGIWEAGVKSTKYHLKRMIGNSVHTFEEHTTMLTEIEACLNSRPLCPVSNDPNDFSILTPAHFLIGDNLLASPRPSLMNINVNRLSVYKQISQRIEHFAKRWKSEYLTRIQWRQKWMRERENVEVGDMVLIKHDDLPPQKWLIGRITEVFPDDEGNVRRVMVKTEKSTLMRPIHKISILPIDRPMHESE